MFWSVEPFVGLNSFFAHDSASIKFSLKLSTVLLDTCDQAEYDRCGAGSDKD